MLKLVANNTQQDEGAFFSEYIGEMDATVQSVVQFVKNIDCFMTLKDGIKNGELDQLVLLKQGLFGFLLHNLNNFEGCFEILLVHLSRAVRNGNIYFNSKFVPPAYFNHLGK